MTNRGDVAMRPCPKHEGPEGSALPCYVPRRQDGEEVRPATLVRLLDEALVERDEAREWVRRITSQDRVLTCVYCGHAYPPGSPEHGAEVLTEHIKTCEKHPMRELQAEMGRLLRDPVVAARAFKLKINASLNASTSTESSNG